MRPVFNDVVLLTPEAPTGGPEALHQLGHEINRLGGNAWQAYCGPQSRVDFGPDTIRCDATASTMPAYFAQYEPRPLREIRLKPGTLVVFPELMAAQAAPAPAAGYRRAIWWLSVDNALTVAPKLADIAYRRDLLADPALLHFHQSDYARVFLAAAGLASTALSDYTDPQFLAQSEDAARNPPIAQRANRLCFFPNKGAALARTFIVGLSLRNPVEIVPIHGMTKAQVRDTLFNAKIYVDFGHHPGKDRVPREAAVAGCIVLLHAQGAARHPADHPLPPEYLFTTADIAAGALQARVDAILDDPLPHLAAQAVYRAAVLRERAVFNAETRAAFFAADGA